jgi:hypothetical protein
VSTSRIARRLILCALLAAGCVGSGRHGGAELEREALSGPKPWTDAPLRDAADEFSFAVVTDRTGEHRDGVFEAAMEKLGLLGPDFVVSVGDLIEGYTEDRAELAAQWDEFASFVARLDVPFFYTPGNHDYSNTVMAEVWRERFGPSFYHFRYRGVLFLVLNSELFTSVSDPEHPVAGPDTRDAQLAYAKRVLEEERDARWTIVLLHQPLWDRPTVHPDWLAVEAMLGTRPYTVFAGHFHAYTRHVRNDRRFITLATTGGGSRMRGLDRGEFDEVALVRMTAQGPVLANLELDGIHPEDARTEEQREVVRRLDKAIAPEPPVVPARGFRRGDVGFRVRNDGKAPLALEGRFEASPDLTPSPERVSLEIAPGAEQRVKVALRAARALDLGAAAPAIARWTLRADEPDAGRAVEAEQQTWLLPDSRFACPRARRAVVVDGALSEWPALPYAALARPSQRDEEARPKGGSFRFGVSYDDAFVYVALDVTDPTPYFDASLSERRQDAIAVTLDARPDPKRSENEGFFRAISGGSMRQLVFAWLTPVEAQPDPIFRSMLPPLPDGARRAVRTTPHGYSAELAVPRAWMDERQGKAWQAFRLEVTQQDYDAEGVEHLTHIWRPSRFGTSESLPVAGSGTFEKTR